MIESLWMYEGIGEAQGRVICPYFPLHTVFKPPYPEQAQRVPFSAYPPILDLAEGQFAVDDAIEIHCSNGGALYLLGLPDEDNSREGILWKLLPGDE